MRIIVMRHGEATFLDNDRILSLIGQKEARYCNAVKELFRISKQDYMFTKD